MNDIILILLDKRGDIVKSLRIAEIIFPNRRPALLHFILNEVWIYNGDDKFLSMTIYKLIKVCRNKLLEIVFMKELYFQVFTYT
jgi:hypothetical protein